jgi:hypothetical protein
MSRKHEKIAEAVTLFCDASITADEAAATKWARFATLGNAVMAAPVSQREYFWDYAATLAFQIARASLKTYKTVYLKLSKAQRNAAKDGRLGFNAAKDAIGYSKTVKTVSGTVTVASVVAAFKALKHADRKVAFLKVAALVK